MAKDARFINEDMPCEACGYNLRGLIEGHRCPECGLRIPELSMPEECTDEARAANRAKFFGPIAEKACVSLDAVEFVWNVLDFTGERNIRARGVNQHFTAQELCWCLRDYALEELGDIDDAIRLLDTWGLRRSEDVGRVIDAMADAKYLHAREHDSIREFDGLFTLDTLFTGK